MPEPIASDLVQLGRLSIRPLVIGFGEALLAGSRSSC
jgi:hypothetical protein